MDLKFSQRAARESLKNASYDPRLLALLHTGCAVALSLVLTILNFFVNRNISTTTGLATMDQRAVLSTLQSVITFAGNIALPFWQLGLTFIALQWAKGKSPTPSSLLEGFRRFRTAVRLFVLQLALIMLVCFVCLEVASILYSFTPGYTDTLKTMQSILEQAGDTGISTVTPEIAEQILPGMIPIYVIFGVLVAAIGIPLFYRFRMAQFALMDDAPGARKAMGASSKMMRGNRWQLFLVDLRFWWYFAAQLVISAVAYLDILLPTLGISLPVDENVLFFGSFILYGILQLGLSWVFAPLFHTTYAKCYFTLKGAATPPADAPAPNNQTFLR